MTCCSRLDKGTPLSATPAAPEGNCIILSFPVFLFFPVIPRFDRGIPGLPDQVRQ